MPNWAMNKLAVYGAPDALRTFLADNLVDGQKETFNFETKTFEYAPAKLFSFEGVAPMPSALEGTISPARTASQLLRNARAENANFPEMPASSEVCEEGVAQAKAILEAYKAQGGITKWVLETADEVEGNWLAKQATGYANWYDWACDNWGTKWDAKDSEVDDRSDKGEIIVDFETPWGAPEAWFQKLVAKYPHLTFSLTTGEADMDWHQKRWGEKGEMELVEETDFRSQADFWGWDFDDEEEEEAVEA